MKMDARDLVMLAAIVDEGGMVRAAEVLGRAQPSLSRSLAALEKRIGTKLFENRRRPLKPTELGLELATLGRMVTKATVGASTAIARHADGISGSLRVGGTPIFMDGVVSGMIAGFQQAYPDVHIAQSYGYSAELMEQLSSGRIDVAVCPMRHSDLMPPYSFQELLAGRNIIACATSHPLARRPSLNIEDIAAYPWVAPPAGSPLYEDLKNTLKGIGLADFKVSFSGGTLSSILNVLLGSEAITVLPYSVVFMQQHFKTLTVLPVSIEHPERRLGLLWRGDRPQKPATERFKGFMRVEFRQLSGRIEQQDRKRVWAR
jgi:DNA-binding transcriptional LysR family regulator